MPAERSIHGCGASGWRRRTRPRSPPWATVLPTDTPMLGTSCMFADLALVAIATEAMVGYPNAVYRLVGHPVSWIGKFITWCDDAWNSAARSSRERRLYGVVTLMLLLAAALLSGLAIAGVLDRLFPGIAALILCGVLASTLLAQRSLDAHVLAVAKGLET